MKKRFHVRIDIERCKGCAFCVSICPETVLAMSQDLNARRLHYAEAGHSNGCSGCRQCANICPDTAIEIEQDDEEPT